MQYYQVYTTNTTLLQYYQVLHYQEVITAMCSVLSPMMAMPSFLSVLYHLIWLLDLAINLDFMHVLPYLPAPSKCEKSKKGCSKHVSYYPIQSMCRTILFKAYVILSYSKALTCIQGACNMCKWDMIHCSIGWNAMSVIIAFLFWTLVYIKLAMLLRAVYLHSN